MNRIKYFEIGETGTIYGVNVKCFENGNCYVCDLNEPLRKIKGYYCMQPDLCDKKYRADKKNVHFKFI